MGWYEGVEPTKLVDSTQLPPRIRRGRSIWVDRVEALEESGQWAEFGPVPESTTEGKIRRPLKNAGIEGVEIEVRQVKKGERWVYLRRRETEPSKLRCKYDCGATFASSAERVEHHRSHA